MGRGIDQRALVVLAWISTSAVPTLEVCTLIDWSLMKAQVRPSASYAAQDHFTGIVEPFSANIFAAG